MTIPLFQVDAFATEPFTGNPAAVCLLDDEPSVEWMQLVAREMNLSETAFVRPHDGGFALRWFTPTVEVALCGHATLAAAHVLFETGCSVSPIAFSTKSGILTAERRPEGIELDFPAEPSAPAPAPEGLSTVLGAEPQNVERNRFDLLVELDSAARVRELCPDIRALGAIDARGVMVTARSDDAAYDFISRFFAPQSGVDEDPVTGSAHCCLAPYWTQRLGRSTLVGYQASSRGGRVRVELRGDRVRLGGNAVTVFRGTLQQPS
jgi:predicted PhzF superfamily epimerase YddE/YHI9